MNTRNLALGMVAGVAGGVAFGVMMVFTGTLSLAGHLMYGGILGASYALLRSRSGRYEAAVLSRRLRLRYGSTYGRLQGHKS